LVSVLLIRISTWLEVKVFHREGTNSDFSPTSGATATRRDRNAPSCAMTTVTVSKFLGLHSTILSIPLIMLDVELNNHTA
jgi:hypothetical protein